MTTWRKSTRSADQSACVELAWRKSTRSADQSMCVEVASSGLARDSKNTGGPTLAVDLPGLVAAIKSGRLDR